MKNLIPLVESILTKAKKRGASEAEVDISQEKGFDVSVRMGAVETVEQHQERGVDITVYFGKRTGTARSTELSEEAIESALDKACYVAKLTNEDACSGLADKIEMAFDYPDLSLYHPWLITPEEAIPLMLACEEKARGVDKRITNSEGAHLSTAEHHYVYANSHGFTGHYSATRHNVTCILIASEKGSMQRDYDYFAARNANDFDSLDVLAERAAKRTVTRLNPKSISSGKVPVIFAPEVAKGLLGHFLSAISGGAQYRRSSFLLDCKGKKVFPEHITLDQRPHLKSALGSAPFDDEGVKTRDLNFVEDGILKRYILGSYSARKLNLKTTGNAGGVHNLFISTVDKDQAALLKEMGTGLLVTELMGQGVNTVTGDYSRGAFGYWVENGEIQYPVEGIAIAGNLKDMYQSIVAVGNDIDHRGNVHTGSIWIDSMMVAGE